MRPDLISAKDFTTLCSQGFQYNHDAYETLLAVLEEAQQSQDRQKLVNLLCDFKKNLLAVLTEVLKLFASTESGRTFLADFQKIKMEYNQRDTQTQEEARTTAITLLKLVENFSKNNPSQEAIILKAIAGQSETQKEYNEKILQIAKKQGEPTHALLQLLKSEFEKDEGAQDTIIHHLKEIIQNFKEANELSEEIVTKEKFDAIFKSHTTTYSSYFQLSSSGSQTLLFNTEIFPPEIDDINLFSEIQIDQSSSPARDNVHTWR